MDNPMRVFFTGLFKEEFTFAKNESHEEQLRVAIVRIKPACTPSKFGN